MLLVLSHDSDTSLLRVSFLRRTVENAHPKWISMRPRLIITCLIICFSFCSSRDDDHEPRVLSTLTVCAQSRTSRVALYRGYPRRSTANSIYTSRTRGDSRSSSNFREQSAASSFSASCVTFPKSRSRFLLRRDALRRMPGGRGERALVYDVRANRKSTSADWFLGPEVEVNLAFLRVVD